MDEETLAGRLGAALPEERDRLLDELDALELDEAGRVVVEALTADPRSWVADAVGGRYPRILLQALEPSDLGGMPGYWLAIAVARHGGEPGIAALVDRLSSDDAEARELALLALNQVGRTPVESARIMLQDRSVGVRQVAAAGLGAAGDVTDVRLLLRMVDVEEDDEVVATVLAAARMICERGSVAAADRQELTEAASLILRSDSFEARNEALLLLGALGRSQLIVEHLKGTSDTYERQSGLLALGAIGDDIAREALLAQVNASTAAHRISAKADSLGEIALKQLEHLQE